ncbi:hypothetical protein SAMN04489718_3133 [Actinopolyspora saharensis]|uniref:Uncharacterized protein n=1 Tax=Actinopolyspora saharensis TaxID=995062 RepID=A0A1H1FNI8_9ACTN|nr:hypothetical protein SAMN04489718_3133 [Actinopolyspora saharensis]
MCAEIARVVGAPSAVPLRVPSAVGRGEESVSPFTDSSPARPARPPTSRRAGPRMRHPGRVIPPESPAVDGTGGLLGHDAVSRKELVSFVEEVSNPKEGRASARCSTARWSAARRSSARRSTARRGAAWRPAGSSHRRWCGARHARGRRARRGAPRVPRGAGAGTRAGGELIGPPACLLERWPGRVRNTRSPERGKFPRPSPHVRRTENLLSGSPSSAGTGHRKPARSRWRRAARPSRSV